MLALPIAVGSSSRHASGSVHYDAVKTSRVLSMKHQFVDEMS